ncbi:MAG TPA: 3-deoxy-8-phosphooctulonate synthase [Saprospiraceae bacterium]|nr:3-deoxy-8-phosphooctulonate synthase [Saprospiraceae bacterium]MCB9269152.1 3-deoxy-8-phosphooctulonate synthase [Lewinellaceae bacterium]HPG05423.1 3-deoxy-8-phosphooctulonate synthase [Saprospiraceae bacterium]HPR00411.1 3-deoxy-8-phosphooctulonate synthase [Saprospiraceae bacterium]HRV83875.1 3-deoxy-8-phosphooctulonate synthase [Saprospiraceae bacterium]
MSEHPTLKLIRDGAFFLIAGPCVVESKMLCEEIAGQVKSWCEQLGLPYIFKASYRKANRSSLHSFQGIGDHLALEVLSDIRSDFHLPVTSDIHTEEEAEVAGPHLDVLQIPAFLCRQTTLLQAAGRTGKIVNIKKGQFMSAQAMQFALEKSQDAGAAATWLTERGNSFGYQDLVVDYRNIPWLQQLGATTILDCTHSLQQPNQPKGVTGGYPELIPVIAQAGVAAGANGLFIETHPKPSQALSDGANMLPLSQLYPLLEKLIRIREALQ